MKKIRFNRIFQILIPLFTYLFIYQISAAIFNALVPAGWGSLICLTFAALFTLPFSLYQYKKALVVRPSKEFDLKDIKIDTGLIALTVLSGILINIIISHTALIHISGGFSQADSQLADGTVPLMILTEALLVPVLEEIVFRGIIASLLYQWYGYAVSMIISSLFFGIFHFNIVQFLYSFIMGLFLSFSIDKTRKIWIPIVSHCLLNLSVIIFTIVL